MVGKKTSPDELSALKTKAEQGDATAQYTLAALYYREWNDMEGDAVFDPRIAHWYQAAADQGHAEAYGSLMGYIDECRLIPVQELHPISFGDPGLYAFLGVGFVMILLSDQILVGFTKILDSFFLGAVVSGVVCLFLSVLLGAVCGIYDEMLADTYPIETTEGTVYIGDVPEKFWFSPSVRLVSGLGMGILVLWAAGVFTALSNPGDKMAFGLVFFLVVFVSFFLSGIVSGRILSREDRPGMKLIQKVIVETTVVFMIGSLLALVGIALALVVETT